MKLRATSFLFGSGIMVNAMGLLTGIMLARLLGPAGRGELATYAFWPPFIAGLLGLSLHTAATFHTARLKGGARVQGIRTLSTIILTVAIAMVPVSYLILLFIDDSRFLSLLGLMSLFYVGAEIIRPAFLGITAGSQQYGALAIFRLLTPALYLAFLSAFALAGSLTPETGLLSIVVASVVSAAIQVFRYWNGLSIRRQFARAVLKSSFRYHPSQILELVRNNLDRLLIVSFLTNEQIGVYFVASTFASAPFAALQQAFSTQILSSFSASRSKIGNMRRLLHSVAIVCFTAIVLWGAFLFILPVVVQLVVGAGYDEVPAIATILALAFAIRMGMSVVKVFLQSIRASISLCALEVTHIGVFLFSFLIMKPSTGIDVAYCVLFSFGANAVVALAIVLRQRFFARTKATIGRQ